MRNVEKCTFLRVGVPAPPPSYKSVKSWRYEDRRLLSCSKPRIKKFRIMDVIRAIVLQIASKLKNMKTLSKSAETIQKKSSFQPILCFSFYME